MKELSVYLSGPITGCSYQGCTNWRQYVAAELANWRIHSYDPMRHTQDLRGSGEITVQDCYKAKGIISSPAIFARDVQDVSRADLLIVFLWGAERVSIGTMFEMGWASKLNKTVITVMEDTGNLHDHPFVREASTMIVKNLDDAVKLAKEILL